MLDFKKLCRKSERILKNYIENKLKSKGSNLDNDTKDVLDNFKINAISLNNDEACEDNKELIDCFDARDENVYESISDHEEKNIGNLMACLFATFLIICNYV